MMSSTANTFGTIYKTTDYSIFNHINSNRKLNPVNYTKLLRSMKEEQLIIPICVNEDYEVIDGQHRLKACEELGLSVYFYVLEGYSVNQMKRANLVSSNWTKDDFLNAYVNEKQKDYVNFAEMKLRYGLNTTDLIKVISRIQKVNLISLGLAFEEGNFKLFAEEYEEVTEFLIALEDFNFFKEYKKSKFVSAFLEMYFFKGYDHSIMKMRLQSRFEVLEVQLTKDDYLKILANKIYSYGTSRNNIYYDLDRQKLYSFN